MIGQWPWPRTTVRDLLLGLTSKGAAVVAFDVLFAEPDRTSLEAIVKQLPESEATAITAAMAGKPSNDEQFAAALKDTPSVLSVALGEGANTTLQAKAGFAYGGDDPRPFLLGFNGVSRNLPSSRMRHAKSARSTGWPIVIRLFAMSTLCSGSIKLSCRLSQRKRFALLKEHQPMCLRHRTRVARRRSDNPPASTTSASATSKCPRMVREGCMSSSATSTRQRIFPPGRCWLGKFRRKISRAASSLSGPALLACSTYGQPRSTRLCPGSIFTPRYSSIC